MRHFVKYIEILFAYTQVVFSQWKVQNELNIDTQQDPIPALHNNMNHFVVNDIKLLSVPS